MNITIPTALAYSALGFCIVFVGLLFLMLVIKAMAAIMQGGKKSAAPVAAPAVVPTPVAAPASQRPLAPGSAGEIKLYNVSTKEAAMIMAIVANQMQKPLNELRFKSIKEVN